MAFDYSWGLRTEDDLGCRIGLPAADSVSFRSARNLLLTNLLLAHHLRPDARVFYPRAHDAFARERRWAPRCFSRRNLVRGVDELISAGLAEEARTSPAPFARWRSTIWATALLVQRAPVIKCSDLQYSVRDPILLRDHHKCALPYRDTALTRAMRRDVLEQNELLARLNLQLHDPSWTPEAAGFLRGRSGRMVNPAKCQVYRVFSRGDWNLGGRFYGGWWLQLDQHSRALLRINEQPVVEHDIKACHLRLLFAMAGTTIPAGDPYDLGSITKPHALSVSDQRAAVKRAILILLNADSHRSALAAITEALRRSGVHPAHVTAAALVARIKSTYPSLGQLWHSGVGLKLQRHDSDVAARVMRRLRSLGIPTLPVHDSFITPAHAKDQLQAAVEEEFAAELFHLHRRHM